MGENLKILSDSMDALASTSIFFAKALKSPSPALIDFVKCLCPTHSCRVQDLNRYLELGSVVSGRERKDQDRRQAVREFIRGIVASVISSWKVDEAGGELLIDYMEMSVLQAFACKSESLAERVETLRRLVEEMHSQVFAGAPERISVKQRARIEASRERILKKIVKEEGLDFSYSENLWNRPEAELLHKDLLTWAVMGPTHDFGPVAIIFSPTILEHPDTYL